MLRHACVGLALFVTLAPTAASAFQPDPRCEEWQASHDRIQEKLRVVTEEREAWVKAHCKLRDRAWYCDGKYKGPPDTSFTTKEEEELTAQMRSYSGFIRGCCQTDRRANWCKDI